MTKYDTYRYIKELNFKIEEFKTNKAILSFCWDELWEIEIEFIKPSKRGQCKGSDEVIQGVLRKESLFVTENHQFIIFRYMRGLDGVELKIYK